MPLMETYKGKVRDIGDDAFHEFRYDMGDKKYYVISSCGYGRTYEIYDALIKEFNFYLWQRQISGSPLSTE